jgi:hypothetical protein
MDCHQQQNQWHSDSDGRSGVGLCVLIGQNLLDELKGLDDPEGLLVPAMPLVGYYLVAQEGLR